MLALSLSRLGSLVMDAGREVSSFFEMSIVVRSGQNGATVSFTISTVSEIYIIARFDR